MNWRIGKRLLYATVQPPPWRSERIAKLHAHKQMLQDAMGNVRMVVDIAANVLYVGNQ